MLSTVYFIVYYFFRVGGQLFNLLYGEGGKPP